MSGLIRTIFGTDDNFVRPLPPRFWVSDIAISALLTVLSLAVVITYQEMESEVFDVPLVPSLISIFAAGILLAFRRRFPIVIMLLLASAHFIIGDIWVPAATSMASMQIVYFLSVYTAMAYARRGNALTGSVLFVYVGMALWMILSDVYARAMTPDEYQPTFWYYVSTLLINVAYFGGATWLGRSSWLEAKSSVALAETTALAQHQADQLADQAVVAERLRLARDLHDSVAHHISLIGIQTAAARRAMATKPEAATEALHAVEQMSRQAVTDLRGLLGSLRDAKPAEAPTHSIDAIEALCADSSTDGLTVEFAHIGEPDSAAELSPAQTSGLLRVTQEALTNIRRHSTATHARVVVRVEPTLLELEVTDNGRPVPNTLGSGLGLVGMRERVSALGGTVDAGPRPTQGYRVLVRIPRSSR